ncbi:MAG: hypothetical protein IIY44_04465 [Erysipelotrichales bacterium]|nr:hypothetical protein [Erysipelotrichales bacterium]MBQ2310782.1 hypothetical protein [Erysipelotrichales bacterium]MBQ5541885.1 hypothetical protein [Erysipelotrichales bacterium]
MGNWFYKMKQKCERFTIPNLTMFVTFCMAAGLVLLMRENGYTLYMNKLAFIPSYVLHGQIWRIFSTLIFPPTLSYLPLIVVAIVCFYSIGSTVERSLGQFEYNFYFFGSVLLGEIAILIAYFITGWEMVFLPSHAVFSVFMAYAILYPEAQILVMYVLPVKAKYVGIAEFALYVYWFITGDLAEKIMVVAALVPVILFFFIVRKDGYANGNILDDIKMRIRQRKRRKEWEDQNK